MRIGRHVLIDVWDADPVLLDNAERLTELLKRACRLSGATVLNAISHTFEPQGVTVLVLLAESHASIHTYPEYCFYSADVFTCGDTVNPKVTAHALVQAIGGRADGWTVSRGERELSPEKFSAQPA
jgi:S-adenosylmethionine decarboxylase proenzyme